jgi:hypothetical protein
VTGVNKLQQAYQLVRNMGMRYVMFRITHELKKRTGWFEKKFPVQPAHQDYISLEEWRSAQIPFFLEASPERPYASLPVKTIDPPACLEGRIKFFNAVEKNLGLDYDWLTHPLTGYHYSNKVHWSKVNDFSAEAGDIKYVWEKSRFAYLYEVIRYDAQHETDHSEWVFNEILSWINANPVNAGPNYKCSQEMSLRLLNWTFALQYYKNSRHLTPEFFSIIQYAMYWQAMHVFDNIHFSRIAVRNNHAITETLALYIIGSLYPQYPQAATWKSKGKRWFEEEIAYQVYEDGTFLQFSMNYHRVVVQLLTWAVAIANGLGEKFENVVYDRAYKSLQFLYAAQNDETGWLPNYGSNDGALFFPLNGCDFNDFRPQLNALHVMLTGKALHESGPWVEDAWWFRASLNGRKAMTPLERKMGWQVFAKGGYAILRDAETISFIRCGSHKDRPAQADNLHLDVWIGEENVLHDAGSYQYNTTPDLVKYFMGTSSHNTVMLGHHDQMLKGSRFIWYYWTQANDMQVGETAEYFTFRGNISCFGYLSNGIVHERVIRKKKGANEWWVEDSVSNKPTHLPMRQLWHKAGDKLRITVKNKAGETVELEKKDGWLSRYYGVKQPATMWVAETKDQKLTAHIVA